MTEKIIVNYDVLVDTAILLNSRPVLTITHDWLVDPWMVRKEYEDMTFTGYPVVKIREFKAVVEGEYLIINDYTGLTEEKFQYMKVGDELYSGDGFVNIINHGYIYNNDGEIVVWNIKF